MAKDFQKGNIVLFGTFVTSIKKIENGIATLTCGCDVELDKLSQVEINGPFDHVIILDCIHPLRAPLLNLENQLL